MNHGGAGVAAQRWQDALGVKRVLTIQDAKRRRLRIASLLLKFEMKIFSIFWNRSIQGPTSISFFGAMSYKEMKEMPGTFFVHWVQNNFISLYSLFRIRKRCIFYCHDEWSVLGIGHYSRRTLASKTCLNPVVLIKRKVLNDSLLILVPTRWLKSQLLASGVEETKVCVIPNPVSDEYFHLTTLHDAEKILRHKKVRPILTFIAHSVKDQRKGLDLFLDTVNHSSQATHDFICFIVGSGAKDYANGDNLVAFEHVSSISILKAIYAVSDCVVVPSLMDNFPQVATEAQSSGTRVVVSKFGGTPETVLSPNVSGTFVDPFNKREFLNALIEIIRSDWSAKDRESLGELAQERWGKESVNINFARILGNI